jgi:hypothetical protein
MSRSKERYFWGFIGLCVTALIILVVYAGYSLITAKPNNLPLYSPASASGQNDVRSYRYVIAIGMGHYDNVLLFTNTKPVVVSTASGRLVTAVDVYCPKNVPQGSNYERDVVGCYEDHIPSYTFTTPNSIAVSERSPQSP